MVRRTGSRGASSRHSWRAGRIGTTANLTASLASAWWLVAPDAVPPHLLPLVIAAGALVHIGGDWITTEGIPRPLTWLLGDRRRLSLNLFRVDSPTERLLVAPTLALAGILLILLHLGVRDLTSLMDLFDHYPARNRGQTRSG